MLGSLVVVLSFCVGTDTPISTTVAHQSYGCGDVISSKMLVSGQPTNSTAGLGSTPAERRVDALVHARCHRLHDRASWAVWGAMGIAGLILLTGWTVLREHGQQVTSVRADVAAGV